MRIGITIVALFAVLVLAGSVAHAGTIQEYTTGADFSTFAAGQSVTTGAGAGWNNLEFNWFNVNGGNLAVGTLYLLTQDYAGTAGGLSNATPGYLAASTAILNGRYIFDAGVSINANTQYFFYTDSVVTALTGAAVGTYGGGSLYTNQGAGGTYTNFATQDANFRLTGDPVPEPATLGLFGLGGAVLALQRRRRMRRA